MSGVDLDALWRTESRRVLATLTRLLGDLDLAEEALHEAFAAALERWPAEGTPARPRAWLVSTGRFKVIDALRRRARFDASLTALHERAARSQAPAPDADDEGIADDQLRLICMCCHPALPEEAQLALTLREVCGLTTEQIARAFLVAPSTVAQRIVRAKARLREERGMGEPPPPGALRERLDAVLRAVYLVFNQGWAAPELAREAVRLGRLLGSLLAETTLPAEPEAAKPTAASEAGGLLALMLLLEARRAARTGPAGELVLLEQQDRSRWDRALIEEGRALLERALATRRFGPYTLQAAIAAAHARASSLAATDWGEIVRLYGLLERVEPSPVIALNRAIALGMRDGPAAALPLVEGLLAAGLGEYGPAHAARADLLRRQGRRAEARAGYERACALARDEPERRALARRALELD